MCASQKKRMGTKRGRVIKQSHFCKQYSFKSVKATSLSGVYQYTDETAINSSNRTLIPSSKEVLTKQYHENPCPRKCWLF